jgi:hypothetical protein
MVPIGEALVMLGLASIPAMGTLTALWLSARARAKKAEAIVHELTVRPALRGEQAHFGTERIEQAIDAIAVEVERISEGQRFTTKLLTDRPERAGPGAPPRVITPH